MVQEQPETELRKASARGQGLTMKDFEEGLRSSHNSKCLGLKLVLRTKA